MDTGLPLVWFVSKPTIPEAAPRIYSPQPYMESVRNRKPSGISPLPRAAGMADKLEIVVEPAKDQPEFVDWPSVGSGILGTSGE